MKIKKIKIVFILILTFFCNFSYAQKQAEFIPGEVLVQLKENFSNTEKIIEKYTFFQGKETKLELIERLSKSMNIWHFKFDASQVNHEKFIQHLALNKNIVEFQNNYIVEQRATTPNDPLFGQQWQYINPGGSGGIIGADIDADLAWDITTGGVTPNGDTIVVCVVDDGLFQAQQDFGDNIWVNRFEIPNNNIDDDNNGYIDDYLGYNPENNDDDIYANGYSHGTAVAGVVGAKGNNNFGVAGINWNVKLMIVTYEGAQQAQVIKAYEYPLEMRKIYNNTGGAKGAFVVAVNSSWGINYGNPASVPLWCAFYDEMGAAGIINAGATANAEINVDVDGDLPTGCSSDYLITVTNVWRDDNKVTDAGYGLTTIDLGAFGRDAYTVSTTNETGFGGFGGTSGATPQVAGAVALLYSAPCPSFSAMYLDDPAAAALKAKEYIMNGTDANTSLQGITVSGGRLNLNGMLTQQTSECSECGYIKDAVITNVTDSKVEIDVTAIGSPISYQVRYRKLGESIWLFSASVNNVFEINNLDAQSNYHFQVKAICADSETAFSSSKVFTTNFLSINALAVEHGIQVYPNPAKNIITIKLKELQNDFEIYFFDISGKLIYEGNMPTQKKRIDLSALQNGIYLLKLKDEKGNVFTHKITKM